MNRYDLFAYKNETAYINKQIEDIEIIKARLEKITPSYQENYGGGYSDKIGDGVAKLIDKQKEIREKLLERLKTRDSIREAVSKMPNEKHQRTILYSLYVSEKPITLIELCVILPRNYDYKYLSKLHMRALDEFDEKFDKK